MAGPKVIDVPSSWITGAAVEIELLRARLGHAAPEHTAGALARLLHHLTSAQRHTATRAELAALLRDDAAADHLVAVGLAEIADHHEATEWAAAIGARVAPVADGEIVLRVLPAVGAIEWYGKLAARSTRAGQARAAGAERDAGGRLRSRRDQQTTSHVAGGSTAAPPATDQPRGWPVTSHAASKPPAPLPLPLPLPDPDQISERARARAELADAAREALLVRAVSWRCAIPGLESGGIMHALAEALEVSNGDGATLRKALAVLDTEVASGRPPTGAGDRLVELLRGPRRAELRVVRVDGEDAERGGGAA